MRRMDSCCPTMQPVLDARHAFLGREFPGGAKRALDLCLLVFGQISEHVAQFVDAAALYRLLGHRRRH